ncbi:MAG TPA: SPOR domain-containing protein [Xanthobacteraceae bacterium]|nr:SPOR domain-containing protein [Xanthobacteraceae bacterium]
MRRTEDPLAELARLIGQEDPFADFVAHRPADGRSGGHAGAQRRPQTRDTRQHDGRAAERRRTAPSARTADAHDEDTHEINFDGRPQADARSTYSYGGGRPQPAGEMPAASSRAPAARPLPRTAAPASRVNADDTDLDYEPQPRSPRDSRAARRDDMDDDGYGEYAAENYDPEYDDDAYLPAHGDEFYDEAPRRRLKGWMLVGVAAVAAIIVGTSGLFAYRALFGTDIAAAPAKVISPESGPTKMVPKSAQAADGKRVQDRVGGEPARNNERIVSREEPPIDQSRIPQSGTADRIPSGTVTAAAPQFSPAPAQSAPAQAAPAPSTAPANFSTEPRRVRTVTVRADGTVVPNQRANDAAGGARTAAAQTAVSPLALQNGAQSPVLPPQRPSTTTSSAPLRGDNPWSSGPSAGQATAPTQQAALPPQPAPTVAVNTPAPAGSYVVQVAAQKSEGEAQQTWQALQQKYSSVLGSQHATIRRVDLGERGVFYRAQVGPFTTRAQASEVCQSLKAAGGECVIQRN